MIVVTSAPAIAATGRPRTARVATMRSPTTMASAEARAGARRDAGEHRIGERIAEQALHHGAAGREQRADHHGKRDARQPHRPQHELVARGERGVVALHKAERGGQAAQRNAGSADRGGNRRRRNERNDERADNQSGRPQARAGEPRTARRGGHQYQPPGAHSDGSTACRSAG